MSTKRQGVTIQRYKKCPECGRTFDLFDPRDADEFFDGHDCESEDQ